MKYAAAKNPKVWRSFCSHRVIAAVSICLASSVILAALTAALYQVVVRQEQPQDRFERAIRNRSTAPSVILLTVVDDRNGQAQTGCAMAPFLLGAIQRETGITSEKELEDVALANTTRVFHFKKQDAIDNIFPFIRFPRMCTAVRQGFPVIMRDMSGDFVIESTGEVLGYPPPPGLD
jgi:hypothetical protein